ITLAFGQGIRLLVDQGLTSSSLAELNRTALIFIGLIVLLGIGTFIRFLSGNLDRRAVYRGYSSSRI
ncbi:MAG: hypothetical protein ACHP9Y_03700, partial [Gammaproteobacteria bacterium]